MSEPFAFWIFLVILFGATAVVWAITGRVARRDDDLAADERAIEADWISDTIGRWGGDVPVPVVTQVLDLHRRYLDGPGFELEEEGGRRGRWLTMVRACQASRRSDPAGRCSS